MGRFMRDIEKFAFFSKAVLSALPVIEFRPDIIHCHDWQTGLIPVYLDNFRYGNEYYRGIKTIMTIHNLKFQGTWEANRIQNITGLPPYYFTPDKLEAYERCQLPEGRHCICGQDYYSKQYICGRDQDAVLWREAGRTYERTVQTACQVL